MFFPPQLYQVDAKGLAGSLLEVYNHADNQSIAATSIQSSTSVVPADRVWLIFHCQTAGRPGAGQTFSSWTAWDADNTGTLLRAPIAGAPNTAGFLPSPVAGVLEVQNVPAFRPYVLLPNRRVTFLTTFSAGALANQVISSMQAWVIPRGRIAFAGV